MSRALCLRVPTRLCLLVAAAVALAAATSRAGQAPPGGFAQGNASYAAGKYAEAVTAYESAVRSGVYSANLFYDLGNAYARLGQRGPSMLNYRRALLLEPGLSQARTNLAYVEGPTTRPNRGDPSWLNRQLNLSNRSLWVLLATLAAWVALSRLVQASSRAEHPRYAAAGFCVAVCAVALGAVWSLEHGRKTRGLALILHDQTRALDAPATSSKVIGHLPVGSEVFILSEQGGWVYAQATGRPHFWLAAADVETIVPEKRD